MARSAAGTASSEIFICIGDQPELDFGGKRNPDGQGFAAFGRVKEGMDVVKKIQNEPTDGQMLIRPVVIGEIVRTSTHKEYLVLTGRIGYIGYTILGLKSPG
jgi:peptidyl-prolyl cis-trans isomerase A (cyclophilin A)